MKTFKHDILYPWFRDAYEHCDSCKFRDHDNSPNYKTLRKKCLRCTLRLPDGERKFYPTEHRKLSNQTPPATGFWGTGEYPYSF